MKKIDWSKHTTIPDVWKLLEELIDEYTREEINKTTFNAGIDDLNTNPFGICISKNIATSPREDFNEEGYVSYDDSSYESSYDEDN